MTRFSITEEWLHGLHGPMRFWRSAPDIGTPIVFIHGYGAMLEHWRSIFRPVASQHSILAFDLYGFGQSAIPATAPSKQLWADQAAELISACCNRPVIVVGHSMGGIAAAQLAKDYPHLVKGLVLVDSTGLSDPKHQPSPANFALFNVARAPVVGETLALLAANPWAARQGLVAAYHRQDRITDELVRTFAKPLYRPGVVLWYLAVTRSFDRLFLDMQAGDLNLPSLLLWGEYDHSIPPSLALYFKEHLLPQAEIRLLNDVGHCPFDEDPETFAKELLDWIARSGL